MDSYNLYYFDPDNTDRRIRERWDYNYEALYRRSTKDRYLVVGMPGFESSMVRIVYHYDKDSSWPYKSMIDLEIKGDIPFSHAGLVDMLVQNTSDKEDNDLLWMPLNGIPNCICRYSGKESIESKRDFEQIMVRMMNIFDPLFKEYKKKRDEEARFVAYGKGGTDFDSRKAIKNKDLDYEIAKVKSISFSALKIPGYQRTYQWGRKNVNQLINDILLVKSGSNYRLGTLVVNEGNIVDGQQRSVTIALLLSQLFRNPEIKAEVNSNPTYQILYKNIVGFWDRTHYKSRVAISNIRKNLELIKSRSSDLDSTFFHHLVDDCEFVVIYLKSEAEAFQFFDSQNSRGKDLSPHDLLKAFHLREMPEISAHDKDTISYWQKIKTEDLESLFLTMYRIKRWSKSLSAREFTKDDVSVFKGFSPNSELKRDKPSLPLFGPAFYLCRCFDGLSQSCFPFQLDGGIINGSLFFDLIRHYNESLESFYSPESLNGHPKTQGIVSLLASYDKRGRIGDTYIRSLFDSLMVYYTDKFGTDYIDSVSELFFLYAYRIRLENSKVSIATVDNEAVSGSMFQAIRDASGPLDVLREEVPPVVPDQNCSKKLKEKFNSLNKLK